MRVRAVLFDVDDTLVDTRGAFRHALERIAESHLPDAPGADELTHFWRADRHGHYRAHTRGEIDYRSQRMMRANDLHGEFGGALMDDEAYDAWNEDFERFFQEGWRPHDDAAAALDDLDALGLPFGGLSNAAFTYQEQKLAACGLARVPMVVGVDTLGFGKPDPTGTQSTDGRAHPFRGKPDPEVFLEGCRRMGTAPSETVYVGDEFDIDGLGALNAGLQSVWLDRPGAATQPVESSRLRGAVSIGLLRFENLDDVVVWVAANT